MQTYIIHYKKLAERKKYLIELFPNAIWIDMYERENLNIEECKLYESTPRLWFERIGEIYKDLPPYRKLKSAEICNSLSHLKALELIIESNETYALILEDDIIPANNFFNELEEITKKLPEDFDLIFLGSAFPIKVIENATLNTQPIQLNVGQKIYKKIPPLTRTVDSYIISLDAAKKLYLVIDKIVHPYDWDLNYYFKMLNLNVYWCEPGIIQQGSMTGKWSSSIR